MIAYLTLSYAWSLLNLASMSSVPLGLLGMTGRSAIICRQVSKNTRPANSVSGSTFNNSCSLFLPATRAPAVLSLGRQRHPMVIISSAMDGPICPRLCQQDESNIPYCILSPSSASITAFARSRPVCLVKYNSL